MQTINITVNDRVLLVAPHPDDECIGAGGIISLYPQLCEIIVLTDGSLGQGNVAPDTEKDIRKKEFYREMELAAVDKYRMLDIEDGTLMKHTDCLCGIDLSHYTKIFVTGAHDNHADHTAAFISVLNAIDKQNISHIEVYLYEVHAPLHEPTHLLDITDVIDKKQQLIRIHESQTESMPYDRLAKVNAEYRALQCRLKNRYIEVYSLVQNREGIDSRLLIMEEKLQKQIQFYQVLTKWIALKIDGIGIASILQSKGYKNIAVYGYAELGQLLCQELRNSDLDIAYVLDKKFIKSNQEGVSIYKPQKELPFVDAVVVTAVYYFDEIKTELDKLGFINIYSLKNLVEDR